MSSIAGIIGLADSENLSEEVCRKMLEIMKPPSIESNFEIKTIPACKTILGRVGFGPDKEQSICEDYHSGICIAWEGELYNDDCQPSCYTDYLLKKYKDQSIEKFTSDCNGSFTAIIADPLRQVVTITNDHTSSHTLFYCFYNNILYFASEVKALVSIAKLQRSIDDDAIISFMFNGFYIGNQTMFKEIKRMDYASKYLVEKGKLIRMQYWEYKLKPQEDKGEKYYIKELGKRLRVAVQRRIKCGTGGLLLSGGVDSRGILCCLDKATQMKIISHTQKSEVLRDNYGDWAIAKRLASYMQMDFFTAKADPEEYLTAIQDSACASDAAAGFVYENVWSSIRENTGVDYLLAGDECFGWTAGRVAKRNVLHAIGINHPSTLKNYKEFLKLEYREELLDKYTVLYNTISQTLSPTKNNDMVDEAYMQQRLTNYILPKRRLIERNGIFVRNPWLDRDVMNFMQTVPSKYRVRKNLFIQALKSLNSDIMNFPYARTNESINYQPYICRGGRVPHFVKKTIFSSQITQRLFDQEAIQNLIINICHSPNDVNKTQSWNPLLFLPNNISTYIYLLVRDNFNLPLRISSLVLFHRLLTLAIAINYIEKKY